MTSVLELHLVRLVNIFLVFSMSMIRFVPGLKGKYPKGRRYWPVIWVGMQHRQLNLGNTQEDLAGSEIVTSETQWDLNLIRKYMNK